LDRTRKPNPYARPWHRPLNPREAGSTKSKVPQARPNPPAAQDPGDAAPADQRGRADPSKRPDVQGRSDQPARQKTRPARREPHPEPEMIASMPDEGQTEPAYQGPPRPFRTGHVTLTGQPNVGKSTLMNRLLGEKIAIVSPKPQTTRDQIRGIWTGTDMQAIFLDTPGIHKARSPLNRAMVGLAIDALESVDVVVLVIDAPHAAKWAERVARLQAKGRGPEAPVVHNTETLADQAATERARADEKVEARARTQESDAEDLEDADDPEAEAKPEVTLDPRIPPGDRRVLYNILRYNQKWMVALNKVDAVKHLRMLPVMQALGAAPGIGAIVPISARTGDGLPQLLESIRNFLPEAEAEYGTDELTDRSVRFLCAELVREQVFLQTREEVPYGVACEVEVFEDLPDLTHLQVLIHVEKQAQRGILVGKAGSKMREIATQARLHMQRLLGRKVFLEVHVRVEPNWSERVEKLKEFGYIL
jgi:GTP-binding protein Era